MEYNRVNTPSISIIIPIFNAEKYLPECIASVRACPDMTMECILINDGSTDSSRVICESVVDEDKRFKLINKDNSGVSNSRNIGIKTARGKYIFFLDADDYIDVSHWNTILTHAHDDEADFIAFGYYSLFSDGHRKEELFAIKNELSNDISDTLFALIASPMLNTCWAKLLRRSVIDELDLRFDSSLVTCEDAVFIIDFIESAHTFLLCNHSVLYYRIHDSSAMHKRPLELRIEDFSLLFKRRKEFLDICSNTELYNFMLRQSFSVLTNMILEFASRHSINELKDACKTINIHPVGREILNYLNPISISPFYKKLEYIWMKRMSNRILSYYMKLKSYFIRSFR